MRKVTRKNGKFKSEIQVPPAVDVQELRRRGMQRQRWTTPRDQTTTLSPDGRKKNKLIPRINEGVPRNRKIDDLYNLIWQCSHRSINLKIWQRVSPFVLLLPVQSDFHNVNYNKNGGTVPLGLEKRKNALKHMAIPVFWPYVASHDLKTSDVPHKLMEILTSNFTEL